MTVKQKLREALDSNDSELVRQTLSAWLEGVLTDEEAAGEIESQEEDDVLNN